MIGALLRKGSRPWDRRGRGWRDMATLPGCLEPPKVEEAGRALLASSEGFQPCYTLIWGFWTPGHKLLLL